MVNSCCAHNCTTRDGKETREAGITFYRIPVKESKRMLWLNAIGRKDFNPKPHTVICSQHFVGGEQLVTWHFIKLNSYRIGAAWLKLLQLLCMWQIS